MMMSRPVGKRDESQIREAIQRFLNGETTNSLAEAYGVKQPTISYWLHKHGKRLFGKAFKLREPGRPKLKEPSERDKTIIARASGGNESLQEIGNTYGISRARVSTILKTWRERSR